MITSIVADTVSLELGWLCSAVDGVLGMVDMGLLELHAVLQPLQPLPVGQFPLANNIIVSKADCNNHGLGLVESLSQM